MNKVSINTFEKGMNLDSSKLVQAKNTAYSLTNFRPWTDNSGKSVGGILNIKGNELSFELPTIERTVKFEVTYSGSIPATDTIGFTIGGVLTNQVFNVVGADDEERAENFVSQINSNAYCISNQIYAYIESPGVFIVYCLQLNSGFDATDGSAFLARTENTPQIPNIQIIGWTTIRDDYYLFTTATSNTTGGDGHILKLEIDEVTSVATLSMIYSNTALGFSTEYPIEAVGRYENECTRRIYWTDNFNEVRTLNTEATKVFETPLDNLNLQPSLSHSVMTLNEIITGGNVRTGILQTTYRLKTSSGAETSFAPLSRMIPINKTSETNINFWEYLGGPSDEVSGKSVEFTVDNLDTDYNFIEVVTLYRKTKNSTPIITSVATEPIPSNGPYSIVISGNESNSFEISLEEFLLTTRVFTHAKTITSKDNRLFAANLRYTNLSFDKDVFDPRAYAFEESSDIFNIDGIAYDLSVGAYTDVPDTADAINDDYTINKFARNSTEYGGTGPFISYKVKTKQLMVDNYGLDSPSGIDFESLPIRLSNPFSTSFLDLGEGRTYNQPNLWQTMKNPYIFDVYKGYQRDETYRFAIVLYDKKGNPGYAEWIADIKIPESFNVNRGTYGTDNFTNGSFRGKLIEGGLPSYANIPYIEFTVDLPQEVIEKVSMYSIVRTERNYSNRTVVAQGLAFKTGPLVNIKASKTLFTPIGEMESEQDYLFLSTTLDTATYSAVLAAFDPSGDGLTDANTYDFFDYNSNYFTVQFPEHLYTNELTNLTGDYIKTVDSLGSWTPSSLQDLDFSYDPVSAGDTDFESIYIRKNYKHTDTYGADTINEYAENLEVGIDNFWVVGEKEEIELDSSIKFRNETFSPYDGAANSAFHGFGQKTILLKTDTVLYSNSFNPATAIHANIAAAAGPELTGVSLGSNGVVAYRDGGYNGTSNGTNHYIVNYKRDLTSQYGGATFNQKSLNTYISTGNAVRVNSDYTSSAVEVFGGDTFITIMDVLKTRKSFDFDSGYVIPRRSMTFLFPVESTINTELRHGRHVQSHLFAEDGSSTNTSRGNDILTGNCDLGESFDYNTVYSAENNIIKYFAKPFDFQAEDCSSYFDTRIAASEPKVNGEVIDSWRVFRTNEFMDLESLYGPINKIHTLNDNFYSFQDNALSVVSINPRVQTTTTDGGSLELGTGNVLHDYTYASASIGCKHQWGVIPSRSHLYWIDINNSKMYRIGPDGLIPLSDFKGAFSYLHDDLIGDIKLNELNTGDNPLKSKGITGYYDFFNNEVVFTALSNSKTYPVITKPNGTTYYVGDIVDIEGFPFQVTEQWTFSSPVLPASLKPLHSFPKGFTICFNEFIQQFSSFYTFESPIYLYNPSTLLSVDSESRTDVYLHNVGNRGEFYGFVNDSIIHMFVNDMPAYTKVFDNFLWHTESVNISNVPQNTDTFYNLNCKTTYQNSGDLNLLYNNTLKRKERTWQTYVPRSDENRERLRDKHLEATFTYDNEPNNRFLVHLIANAFRPSIR